MPLFPRDNNASPGGAAWGDITGDVADQTDLQTILDAKALSSHNHDATYEAKNANIQAHIASVLNPHSVTKSQVGLSSVDNTSDAEKPISTAQQTALDGKAATGHNHDATYEAKNANIQAHITSTSNPHGVTKAQVGLTNVDDTSDANKPVSTAQQTAINAKVADAINDGTTTVAPSQNAVFDALALKAPLASPALTGVPTAPTAAAGTNTTQVATTAFVTAINNNAVYSTILEATGSHIAARAAGTYGFGHGDPLAVTGTGTLYPLQVLRIDSADYPTINGLTAKLRVKATLFVNDVAPTGNFTFGLHPVTRPATSGGAGLVIYTIGAAVASSTAAINTPAADSMNTATSADFAVPADGYYVLGVVTTATVAVSSHLHLTAKLQTRNA